MDTKLKLELIQKAQRELVGNPQDPMHEITHHYRVVQLAKQLIVAENLLQVVDVDLVEVVCWWHDVKVSGIEYPEGQRVVETTAKHLRELVPADLGEVVFDAVVNHEFGSFPSSMVGKILQDADKLEILSPARVDLVIDYIKAGVLDSDKMLQTLQNVRDEWLPNMPTRYNFGFSKKYHTDSLGKFSAYLDQAEKLIRSYSRN